MEAGAAQLWALSMRGRMYTARKVPIAVRAGAVL
jgi:hypothetical protein